MTKAGRILMWNPNDTIGLGEGVTFFLEAGHDSLLLEETLAYMQSRSTTATMGPPWFPKDRAAEQISIVAAA